MTSPRQINRGRNKGRVGPPYRSADGPATTAFFMRMTPQERAALDVLRQDTAASAFIRDLIREYAQMTGQFDLAEVFAEVEAHPEPRRRGKKWRVNDELTPESGADQAVQS